MGDADRTPYTVTAPETKNLNPDPIPEPKPVPGPLEVCRIMAAWALFLVLGNSFTYFGGLGSRKTPSTSFYVTLNQSRLPTAEPVATTERIPRRVASGVLPRFLNGKENGNYYNGLYRNYRVYILGLYYLNPKPKTLKAKVLGFRV